MILRFLWKILYPEPIINEKTIDWFSDKPYHEMTRREKRQYKRWLQKNDMWDAHIVFENQDKIKKFIENRENARTKNSGI